MIQTPASNPNPSTSSTYVHDNHDDLAFELSEFSDYLAFADQIENDYTCNFTSLLTDSTPAILQDNHTSTESSMNSNHDDMDNAPVLQVLVIFSFIYIQIIVIRFLSILICY